MGFVLLVPAMLNGQSGFSASRTLSLENCIQAAQSLSPEATIARKRLESVYWSYKAFRAGLLPQLQLDVNGPGLVRSISQITQPDGTLVFAPQNQAFSSASLSLSQQIVPTGGTIFLQSGLNRLDVFGGNGYSQYQSRPVLIGLQQPLFRFNELRWGKKIQPLRYQIAEKSYLEELEDIAITISGQFFDVYLAQMTLENTRRNLAVNDSIYMISKGRFNVGRIAENDLLQTELAFLNVQAQVKQAETDLLKAETNLRISLGLPDTTELQILPPPDLPWMEVDPLFALAQASLNRSDYVDYQVREAEANANLTRTQRENRFSANLSATFGLNQSGNTVTEAYSQPLEQQMATFGVGVPILQWGRAHAQIESAKVEQIRVQEQIKLEKRRLERDIRFQVMDFQQMQSQLKLAAKADTIAQRRYEVAKNRYLIGKIDITNLQIAQTEQSSARQSYILALRQYWLAYFQLRRSTLYDFMRQERLSAPGLEDQ